MGQGGARYGPRCRPRRAPGRRASPGQRQRHGCSGVGSRLPLGALGVGLWGAIRQSKEERGPSALAAYSASPSALRSRRPAATLAATAAGGLARASCFLSSLCWRSAGFAMAFLCQRPALVVHVITGGRLLVPADIDACDCRRKARRCCASGLRRSDGLQLTMPTSARPPAIHRCTDAPSRGPRRVAAGAPSGAWRADGRWGGRAR